MTVAPTPHTTILHLQCRACECRVWAEEGTSLSTLWLIFHQEGWRQRIVEGGTLYACPEHPFDEEERT